jgi:hypothetical protein
MIPIVKTFIITLALNCPTLKTTTIIAATLINTMLLDLLEHKDSLNQVQLPQLPYRILSPLILNPLKLKISWKLAVVLELLRSVLALELVSIVVINYFRPIII